MKKYALLLLSFSILSACSLARAADEAAPVAAGDPAVPEVAAAETAAPAEAVAPVVENAPAVAENLEFVSGEISAVDEAAKSVTIKLYGETENEANDKLLSVTLDASTDITDGEKDRELKSLTAGTEVDVEYDPASSKATYIFVY